jgi:hypothetical protein
MASELVYTSSEQGLKPGTHGYCTVAMTRGLGPPVLVERLEGLSGYRAHFPAHDPRAADNPVNFAYYQFTVGGRACPVLSRVGFAGFDYTGRSNKLAHHVVLDAADERPAAGPTALALEPGFFRPTWSGAPQWIEGGRQLPQGGRRLGPAATWEEVAGDAGWAGVLAEHTIAALDAAGLAAGAAAAILFPPGFDSAKLLRLLDEAMALIPPARRWDVTYSTYLTDLPTGTTCVWRCVIPGSPEWERLGRTRNVLCLDLTGGPLGQAAGGPLVDAARSGDDPYAPATVTFADGPAASETGAPAGGPGAAASPARPAAAWPAVVVAPADPAFDAVLADLPPAGYGVGASPGSLRFGDPADRPRPAFAPPASGPAAGPPPKAWSTWHFVAGGAALAVATGAAVFVFGRRELPPIAVNPTPAATTQYETMPGPGDGALVSIPADAKGTTIPVDGKTTPADVPASGSTPPPGGVTPTTRKTGKSTTKPGRDPRLDDSRPVAPRSAAQDVNPSPVPPPIPPERVVIPPTITFDKVKPSVPPGGIEAGTPLTFTIAAEHDLVDGPKRSDVRLSWHWFVNDVKVGRPNERVLPLSGSQADPVGKRELKVKLAVSSGIGPEATKTWAYYVNRRVGEPNVVQRPSSKSGTPDAIWDLWVAMGGIGKLHVYESMADPRPLEAFRARLRPPAGSPGSASLFPNLEAAAYLAPVRGFEVAYVADRASRQVVFAMTLDQPKPGLATPVLSIANAPHPPVLAFLNQGAVELFAASDGREKVAEFRFFGLADATSLKDSLTAVHAAKKAEVSRLYDAFVEANAAHLQATNSENEKIAEVKSALSQIRRSGDTKEIKDGSVASLERTSTPQLKALEGKVSSARAARDKAQELHANAKRELTPVEAQLKQLTEAVERYPKPQ